VVGEGKPTWGGLVEKGGGNPRKKKNGWAEKAPVVLKSEGWGSCKLGRATTLGKTGILLFERTKPRVSGTLGKNP